MVCESCKEKRMVRRGRGPATISLEPTAGYEDAVNIVDNVPVVSLETDEPDERRILKGVFDFLAPSRGTLDAAGMGDTFLMSTVVQALVRRGDRKIRFVTLDNVRDWAWLATNGECETVDIHDKHRMRGEFSAWSSSLNTYRVDEVCLDTGMNRHQFYANQFTVDYDEVQRWIARVDGRAIEKTNQWLSPALRENRPVVALSPFATKFSRTWPLRKWFHLALLLRERGIAPYILDHPRMKSDPSPARHLMTRTFVSSNVQEVAALVMQTDLLISGDTGTAHLAGWCRTPALALCGPTMGTVALGGWPTVEALQAPCSYGTTGCTWAPRRGWKEWCALGCDALEGLDVHAVEQRAIEMLAQRREL